MSETTNKIITISRAFGSGGLEIGRKLAERFAIPFYDRDLIAEAARDCGANRAFFDNLERNAATGCWRSAFGGGDLWGGVYDGWKFENSIYAAQTDAIRRFASRGPCVFVGRCADVALAETPNLYSIFLFASLEYRVERTIRLDGVAPEKARAYVRAMDKRRQNYYNERAEGRWGDAANYRLCLDVGAVGIDRAVGAIATLLA